MAIGKQTDYLNKLLDAWELTYKKGQMSFWILFTLSRSECDVQLLQRNIQNLSKDQIQFDEQSLYRSLRRFYDTELVDFQFVVGQKGPQRKVYKLTELGLELLKRFLQRNFLFMIDSEIQEQMKHLIK